MPDPTYEDVYEPPMLDSTGQDLVSAIQNLSAPSATNVALSPTGMHIVTEDDVQGAVSEIDAKVYEVSTNLAKLQDNDLAVGVDISSYTSTMYECPSDGFVVASTANASNSKSIIRVFGSTNNNYNFNIGGWSNSTYGSYACFVKKGMRLQVVTLENSGTARFFPLTSAT